MPLKRVIERAKRDKRAGKSASTQAGEFVREEMRQIGKGKKRGPKSQKQAIAIGLSEARKAGGKVPAKTGARKSATTRSS